MSGFADQGIGAHFRKIGSMTRTNEQEEKRYFSKSAKNADFQGVGKARTDKAKTPKSSSNAWTKD
jgi:hypothetical protein